MPPGHNLNTKLPGSSSSVSLEGSPTTDEFNYDSDISEDDHAIAEGDDDSPDADDEDVDEDEPSEQFEILVSTLTGNTFSVMIHPLDTVEVLKTRIAFQEGISPADQNLLIEQGKLLDSSTECSTIQELSIDRHTKLTLVTNMASGLPYNTGLLQENGFENGVSDSHSSNSNGDGDHEFLLPPSQSFKLAPAIKRNYHKCGNTEDKNQSINCSQLRLPKILSTGNFNNNDSNSNHHHQCHNEDSFVSSRNCSSSDSNVKLEKQPDEREWMQSLFNKAVEQEQEEEGIDDIDEEIGMDSTTATSSSTAEGTTATRFTRKVGNNFTARHEEDGSILIVQGDDGVILIIQKNTGQLLDDAFNDSNNNKNGSINKNKSGFDLESYNGRAPGMGQYQNQRTDSSLTLGTTKRKSYQGSKVHEKIKENAVTLEKMRQVRSLMAQKQQQRLLSKSVEPSVLSAKSLEFPKISETSTKSGKTSSDVPAVANKRYLTRIDRSATRSRFSNSVNNSGTLRSINSSKMSMNRLIAEIYLQSKRKSHAFQPGQPPYTEQQLLRYVQLKVAILLDEQRKNKTGPCSKCQLDEDWTYNKAATYLVPTVVMNRYRRLSNGHNSRSLDVEVTMNDEGSENHETSSAFRKSINPIGTRNGVSLSKPYTYPGDNLGDSHIPRLVNPIRPSFGSRDVGDKIDRGNGNDPTTISRRTSSSQHSRLNIGTSSRSGTGRNARFHREGTASQATDTFNNLANNSINKTINGNNNRPSLKIYPKLHGSYIGHPAKQSSRPGSSISNKGNTEKKEVVRCQLCKKKIGIACRYQCRCGLTYCSIHRYPEAHDCTFDYKTAGRNQLRENNPVILAPKIQEI